VKLRRPLSLEALRSQWFVSNDAGLLAVARNAHLDIEIMTIGEFADLIEQPCYSSWTSVLRCVRTGCDALPLHGVRESSLGRNQRSRLTQAPTQ